MVNEVEYKGKKCFKCSECGFIYKEKSIAEKCESWCRKHKSCNMKIIAKAITIKDEKRKERK